MEPGLEPTESDSRDTFAVNTVVPHFHQVKHHFLDYLSTAEFSKLRTYEKSLEAKQKGYLISK